MVCALGERRAPPGSAGLGQSTVGGHVRSEAAHKPARQSGVMKRVTDCVCVCVGTGKCLSSEFVFIFSAHSLVPLRSLLSSL